jgi:hypothetical protein
MKKSIVWIDDNPDRERTARDLGARFINVKNADLASEIEKLIKGSQRSLVILDHVLDKTSSKSRIFTRGSTIAEAIKEKWPDCPVLGVTNGNRINDIDLRTKQTYDDLYSFSDFGKYFGRIKPIARDFACIASRPRRKVADVIRFLKPPPEEEERLEAALPDDLKRSYRDASFASLLYRWIKQLMSRAGFLYDKLETATYLGLNEKGFEKASSSFDAAKYKGLFSNEDDPRWWSNLLGKLLYEISQAKPGELSWHVGRRLPSVKSQDYSRCYACKKDFPEVVAYLDAVSLDRYPMHVECTILHPRYKRELYFDDVRMLRGK